MCSGATSPIWFGNRIDTPRTFKPLMREDPELFLKGRTALLQIFMNVRDLDDVQGCWICWLCKY